MSSIDENATVFESCPSDNISSRSNSESQTNTVFGRMTARAGLNVPTLNTMSIVGQNDVSSNNNTYIRSSYFTIPPGLSPTTLLESPVFLSSSLAQQSPTTGKFQFTPGGNDTNSNSNSENVDSAFFSFRPVTESSYSSFIGTSSKINAVHESSAFSSRTEKERSQMLHSQSQASPYFPIDINRGSNVKVVDISGGKNLPPLDVEISDQIGGGDATYVDASEDGYNWRKYGQKQVKGSDYPRSYYKCTHLSCTVKKKVERSYEGHITEIIYKGAHNHSKPHPNKGLAFGLIDPRSGNNVQMGVTFDGSLGFSNDDDDDEDVSDSKIRKMEEYVSETSGATRAVKKPKVVVQTTSQVDILDDGYHWRKYGQKVVKGNPNPRSYYKCTSPGCIVRKHVERASHDLNSVITTYEGKHNHDVPAARNSGYSNLGSSDNRVAQIGNTAHLQRPEQSQVQNVFRSNWPTDMSSLGFGYGVNEAGLASLVMARLDNEAGLASLVMARLDHDYEAPIQPQFGHASEMRFLLPKGEPNLESISESCSMNIPNSSSVYSHVTRNYE